MAGDPICTIHGMTPCNCRNGVFSREEQLRIQLTDSRYWLADVERLDWLERETATLHCNFCHPDDWSVTVGHWDGSAGTTYSGDSIREAIDAAMSAPPPIPRP